ncbi:MAG: hypothetical protein ABH871_04035 [Pseudomonadota bacterium]
MFERKGIFFRAGIILLFFTVFVFFFNGYQQSGPSRKKFQKLPGGTEDVTAEQIQPEGEDKLLKALTSDRRLNDWVAFWKTCIPGFTMDFMEDSGESEIESDPVDVKLVQEERKGPGKMFYKSSPGGGRSVNPYWRRLVYKNEQGGWQPYIELPCSAILYESSTKSARIILSCTMFEGIHEAVWLSKNRLVLLGYESVSRQMDVRCETVKTCAAPAIWVVEFDKGYTHSYRGNQLIKRSDCDLDVYLKKKVPGFFGKDKK